MTGAHQCSLQYYYDSLDMETTLMPIKRWADKDVYIQNKILHTHKKEWNNTICNNMGVVLVVKNLPANAGDMRDMGLIPGCERSPGGGHGNPLQYSCLKNPMDRGAW